jgi:hypothetical protein
LEELQYRFWRNILLLQPNSSRLAKPSRQRLLLCFEKSFY